VWIHGGSFTGGDKAQAREKNFGTNLAAAGYVVASVNYRMGDGAWPQNIRDCKNAVRFLRAHAAEYRIDPARIGVAGGSAGAYLALMVGFAGDGAPFDPGAAYPGVSDRVRAVIDFYGPSNFLSRQSVGHDGKPTGMPRAKPVDSPAVFNAKPGDTEIFRKASAVGYVTRDAPPVLICQGTADPEVDYLQAVELDAVLGRNGVPHELHLLDGIGHSFDLESWRKQPLPVDLKSIVLSFLAKSLGHGETR
jgi:acetyl esterase/lipase